MIKFDDILNFKLDLKRGEDPEVDFFCRQIGVVVIAADTHSLSFANFDFIRLESSA
jgi:hypothetical protein